MKKNFPQPKTVPILGNLLDLDVNSPEQSRVEISKRYDGIYKMDLPSRSFYVVTLHRLANELCYESRFDKRLHGTLQEIRNFAGDGLFTAHTEEPNWKLAHVMKHLGVKIKPEKTSLADQHQKGTKAHG